MAAVHELVPGARTVTADGQALGVNAEGLPLRRPTGTFARKR